MSRVKAKKIELLQDNASNEPLSVSIGAALGQFTQPEQAVKQESIKPDKTMASGERAKPKITKAVLQRARAGGGRWVVRVLLTPVQSKGELESMARELRRALGTGARLEDDVLVVQGDIPDRIESWLKDYGVPKIVR